MLAHLYRGRRDAGDRLACLVERGEVADHERRRMSRQREVREHAHASRAVELDPERASERRTL
jgi:hypothetical protein